MTMSITGGQLWVLVAALSLFAYLCKALGFVVVGSRVMPALVERCLALIPASLLAALVAKDSFSTGQALVIDARAAGVAVAVVAVWRRAPFILVVAAAMAVTALVRTLG
jgi:branched-subunit amino acid transport protein